MAVSVRKMANVTRACVTVRHRRRQPAQKGRAALRSPRQRTVRPDPHVARVTRHDR